MAVAVFVSMTAAAACWTEATTALQRHRYQLPATWHQCACVKSLTVGYYGDQGPVSESGFSRKSEYVEAEFRETRSFPIHKARLPEPRAGGFRKRGNSYSESVAIVTNSMK